MDNKLKLEEVDGINFLSYKFKKYFLLLLLLLNVWYIWACVKIELFDEPLVLVMNMILLNFVGGLPILMIYLFPQYNKDYKEIKKTGHRKKGYIVDNGYSVHSRGAMWNDRRGILEDWRKYFYIKVVYENQVKSIYRLKCNKAYKILELLLDSQDYPVRHVVKIPIDVYVDKKKVYADLESVDLLKIKGYGDAKKMLENKK